jgi:glycosyltransferase involved in cell wall biosynthesis
MKVALILPSLAHTGPILVARDIVKQLKDKVDVIDVYYFDDITDVQFDCPVLRIGFEQAIDFRKYDIVHSHMYRPDKYVWKNRAMIRGACISTLHCDIRSDLRHNYNLAVSWVFRWVWLRFLTRMDKLVAISGALKDGYYASHFPPDKLAVIYNGKQVGDPTVLPEQDRQVIDQLRARGLKVIGACALLTRRKGLHYVIKALPELKEYGFVIVGDGKERKRLEALAQSCGVSDRCIFLGFRQGAEAYMPLFDVYAMPSVSEGFGLALVEAALARRSCLCSDIATFRELFPGGEVTFFKSGDVQSLVAGVEAAYRDRLEKGEMAFQHAVRHFTVSEMGRRYHELYEQLGR